MISKEIEELAKERRVIETEVAQKEADIRIKSGEVRSLQVRSLRINVENCSWKSDDIFQFFRVNLTR
jgi:hypothetical protein